MNETYKLSGGCHCGNITVTLELTAPPATYQPRACDCDFCRKHGAAYVSDPKGSLVIQTRHPSAACTYRQGSAQAEMLLCATCGVLIGALYRGQRLYAAVNSRAVGGPSHFGSEQSVSPQKLSAQAKAQRWQDLWFCRVDYHRG